MHPCFKSLGHFRGRIKIWDVVNESLAPDGTLANNVFLRKLGLTFQMHSMGRIKQTPRYSSYTTITKVKVTERFSHLSRVMRFSHLSRVERFSHRSRVERFSHLSRVKRNSNISRVKRNSSISRVMRFSHLSRVERN